MVLSMLSEGATAAVDLRGVAFSEAERVIFRAGVLTATAFRFASGVGDRFYVVEEGRVIETFDQAAVIADQERIEALLGV